MRKILAPHLDNTMVGYSVQWILLASVLVGCVLFGTVASDETPSLEEIRRFYHPVISSAVEPPEKADEPLLLRLQRESLKPERLRDILKGYGDQGEKILHRTVAVLVEMCEPSLKNCSYEGFERVIKIGDEFKETIPKLYEYSQYCLRTELRGFCRDNADKVIQDLEAKVDEKDRSSGPLLLDLLRGLGKIDNEDIVKAYFDIRGNVASLDDDKDFLQIVKNALFLHYIEVLGKKISVPESQVSRPRLNVFDRLRITFLGYQPEDEVLITAWDILDRIVERFIHPVSSQIEERFYEEASQKLKSYLLGESLEPEAVKTTLVEYKHKDVKICNDTVGELVEMWQESLTKCNYDAFERILSVEDECKEEVPKLFEYRRHCALVRLENYCCDHFDQVVPDLEKAVMDEDKELVSSILKSLPKAEALDKASVKELDANIAQAYTQVKKSDYRKEVFSLSEEKDFLARVKRALFLEYLQVSAESRATPEDGMAATKRDNLSIILERFIRPVSAGIKEAMYERASEALKSRLVTEQNDLTGEMVADMFRGYEHKEVKIYEKPISELLDLCEPSLNHCTPRGFLGILSTSQECKDRHGKIFEYKKYCAYGKMVDFCRENVEKMLKLLFRRASEEDKLVLFYYMEKRGDCIIDIDTGINTALSCTKQALGKMMNFTYKKWPSHEEAYESLLSSKQFLLFREKICILMSQFAKLKGHIFMYYRFDKEDKDAPEGDYDDIGDKALKAMHPLKCSDFGI